MTRAKKEIGLLAEYDSPHAIYQACEKIRDAGVRNFDSYTPFPVHGLDKAMGLGPSYLPWLVLVAGTTGACLAMFFMIWCSVYDYPLNIGGKPVFSIPAFIPITFEVTVLFSGLTAVFGMFALNKLPTFNHPLFNIKDFARVTDDAFFVMIESRDKKYDRQKMSEFLSKTGAKSVVVVEN
ncbi:MAG: DUF3341 domain-containing protein [Myxococcales bacterium]|nr:DUF3341 domain-containing protein [Myxococcales bacterium]USN50232.1 MAG: DUF3341 domain-containing protein [Myxococcales bacterium]